MIDHSTAAAPAYEATHSSNRRRPIKVRPLTEDRALPQRGRDRLNATTQDQIRNFAITAWVVRKHLDYTTQFTFQAQTDTLDDLAEAYIAHRSAAALAHTGRRHPLRRLLRLAEAQRIVHGDLLLERATDGSLNPIEADRLRNPLPDPDDRWVQGILLDDAGRPLAYHCTDRGRDRGRGKTIPAKHAYLHAYHDAHLRFDSPRGVSPLAAALNAIRDTAEGIDLALARLKIAQIFGLAVTRDQRDDDLTPPGDPTEDSDGDDVADAKYQIDLAAGPFQLELDPGEDAKFLDSATPATQTVDFLKLIVLIAMKALDVPYSFFDESHTNFFGSRGALLHYLRSARIKQQDCSDLLDWWTTWQLDLAVADGTLPPALASDRISWQWIPDGVPWWDPSKEVHGHLAAIGAHLDNVERVCQASGTDFYDNLARNSRAAAAATAAGLPLQLGRTPTPATDAAP